MTVPFFRPDLTDDEIDAVVRVLRSGWLTTGPETAAFEREFADAVGARHAIALNSCTAAMHLAVEALALRPGQGVLVPTMTFAATAEVVRYMGAVPVLVDCDPATGFLDLGDAETKLAAARAGRLPRRAEGFSGTWRPGDPLEVVGIIPVHVAGAMADIEAIAAFAEHHGLWVIEDAAHSFPAARRAADGTLRRCGEGTAAVTCFSFYANKTITAGEGGMAVTNRDDLAERMRLMSLHGLSKDAWGRYAGGPWDYRIVAAGFKYNLTDVAAALGRRQLARAEELRQQREHIARCYREALADVPQLELPPLPSEGIHAWHLFVVRLVLARLRVDRDRFVELLRERGIGFSVHWRPLHLHPLYAEGFGWRSGELPQSTAAFPTLVTLPLFPRMREEEVNEVVRVVRELCEEYAVEG